MKAMILAAGYGSRLGHLSQRTPKCLVSVGGKTMLEIVIGRLVKAGVTEVVINLHHLANIVEEYIRSQNNFGITVHLSHETSLLGTGGGIKNARHLLDGTESFFVHNADVYSEIDLMALRHRHELSQALVTLAVIDRQNSRPLLFTQSGLLCGHENQRAGTSVVFGSDPHPTPRAFTGIQIISPRFFRFLDHHEGEFSSITPFLEAAEQGEQVLSFDVSGSFWAGVDTPERLEELRALLERNHH